MAPGYESSAQTQVKKPQVFLFLGICATGFLCGFAGKHMTRDRQHAGPGNQVTGNNEILSTMENASGQQSDAKAKSGATKSSLRSSDTLETIAALDDASLYGRLALWMVDASERDIAAYWQSYRQRKNRSNDINDLIFINWTRLNPQAAISATAGTGDEHYAWWAWACHDPKASLAAAIATNPDRVNNVAWGIGEFHPDWLRQHFNEIPESGRGDAIAGMTKWDDKTDPLATLAFLKEHGNGFNPGIFKSLVLKDPLAAYDWIQKNGNMMLTRYGGGYDLMGTFVTTTSEQHPEVLERLAEQTPSGALKWKMEDALFKNLLKTDPEAAIEQATATKAPKIAAERLAAVGMSLVNTDPDRAFEMAKNLFGVCPGALNGWTTWSYANGSSTWGSRNEDVNQLMDALIARDPARVMEMKDLQGDGASGNTSDFTSLAGKWAARDLTGYANWVNGQTDPVIREPAAMAVICQLQGEQQYAEAADWAMSLEKSKDSQLLMLLDRWKRTNPDEALKWLESSDLPEQEKQNIRKSIGGNQ
jgi:hypothetical protein